MKKINNLLVIGVAMATVAVNADTYYWKNDTVYSDENWKLYSDWQSWAVGTSSDAGNPNQMVPQSTDDLYYGINNSWKTTCWMNLGGGDHALRCVVDGDLDFAYRFLNLKNGSLTFSGSMTNSGYRISLYDAGTLCLGAESSSRFGRGDQSTRVDVFSGGTLDVKGRLDIVSTFIEVHEGGLLLLDPTFLGSDSTYQKTQTSSIINNGEIRAPNGFTFGGTGASTMTKFDFMQNSGTLNLGGDVTCSSQRTSLNFYLNGGLVNVLENVAFVDASGNYPYVKCNAMMTNDCSVTANVVMGKTFDVSNMTFGERTTLTKRGPGIVKVASALPASLVVMEGVVEPKASTQLGTALTLSADASLRIAASGVTATAINGIENASVQVPDGMLSSSCVLFSSTNSALLSVIASKLATAGVIGAAANGNAVTYDIPHDSSVFFLKSSDTQTGGAIDTFSDATSYMPFFSAATWSIGRDSTAGNPNGYVPGPADDIFINTLADTYRTLMAFDMGGATRLVRNYDKEGATERWGFNGIQVRNGTFGFTGNFKSTRSVVIAQDGGRFELGEDADVTLGNGDAQCFGIVKDGGEIVLRGSLNIVAYQADVRSGGYLKIDPKGGSISWTPNSGSSPRTYFDVSGTFDIPNGVAITSKRGDNSFSFNLHDGSTLNLGGSVTMTSGVGNFELGSATVNVKNKIAITNFRTCNMLDNSVATFNVPKGSSINLSEMTFGANTTIEQYGAGRIIFGESRPTKCNRHDSEGLILLFR